MKITLQPLPTHSFETRESLMPHLNSLIDWAKEQMPAILSDQKLYQQPEVHNKH